MTKGSIERTFWQIAAGPRERIFADELIRFGVGLIGPGDPGRWSAGRSEDDFEGASVRWLATEVQVGDVFLLRSGRSRVVAVGLVASEYLYLDEFDDVNGWDLQHARRVRWLRLPEEHEFGQPVFGANPRRLSRVNDSAVLAFAEGVLQSPPHAWQTAPLPSLPEAEVSLESVPAELRDLVAQVRDLRGLYRDERSFGAQPSEHEVVAHYVVPLLRALGWPPELVAVEWRHVDVCVFRSLPRSAETSRLIVEAKGLGAGIEGALPQAREYLKTLKIVGDALVTDGIRYRLYDGTADLEPVAYANLERLKPSALQLFERLRRK